MTPPALVLAGGTGWDDGVDQAVAEVPPHLKVVRTGYLRPADLPGLLGGAMVVAYPSKAEGFGLPVLEAMACGAAVLTTRRLSLPEVGGDAVGVHRAEVVSIEDGGARTTCSADRADRDRLCAISPWNARRSSPGPGTLRPLEVHRRGLRRRAARAAAASGRVNDERPAGIVVVTYLPGGRVAAFLDSVPAAVAGPVEVVLADNDSTDGSIETCPGASRVGAAATDRWQPRLRDRGLVARPCRSGRGRPGRGANPGTWSPGHPGHSTRWSRRPPPSRRGRCLARAS